MPHNWLDTIVRLIVTVGLLAYGFLLHGDDPTIGNLIIGAVVGYWLREGEGQALRRRRGRGARATDETATTSDD